MKAITLVSLFLFTFLAHGKGETNPLEAKALEELGPAAKEAVIPLCHALRDEDDQVSVQALRALRSIGGDLEVGVPTLLSNLANDRLETRFYSAIVLTQTQAAKAAVPPICDALLHGDQDTLIGLGRGRARTHRSFAANSLGKMGLDAKAAVPALILATKDDCEVVREAAVEALKRIDPEAADNIINPH